MRRSNRLLALLPQVDFDRLAERIAVVDLKHHDVLYEIGEEPPFVYFPLTAVISVIPMDSAGRAVEAASVGREGLVGLSGALGGGAP